MNDTTPTKYPPNSALRPGMVVTTCGCCVYGEFVGYKTDTGAAIVLVDECEYETENPSVLSEFIPEVSMGTMLADLKADAIKAVNNSFGPSEAVSGVRAAFAKAEKLVEAERVY